MLETLPPFRIILPWTTLWDRGGTLYATLKDMRLFTALELNSKIVAHLTELVRRLRPYGGVRWVHPLNMHVTLKYIGEWPAERLEEVIHACSEVKLPSVHTALNVPLAGMGFFPDARSPRVFWVGAENTPALRKLASGVDAALQPLGIAPEVRPYQPHLTLGRVGKDVSLDDLLGAVEDLPSREFGTISPDRFVLFESTSTQSGPIYRKLAEFPFIAPLSQAARAAGRMFSSNSF